MPLLLRGIRKRRWSTDASISGLSEGEIQADAFGDLSTSKNTLSVWHVEDDKSNIDQVITAFASNRDNISNFDYVLFNTNLVSNIGINIEQNPGATPFEAANHWHRDLTMLTASKLFKLIDIICNQHIEKSRVKEKDILKLINKAVENNLIQRERLKEKIVSKLN
ncbi:MAG: hypothetical protein AAFO95_00675 [Cyanobacteria bacterium J06600_6]